MALGYYTSDHIEITFSATLEKTDYGVPKSPVWYDIDPSSVEVESLTILGIDVKIKDLPTDLSAAILALYGEVDFFDD